MENFTQQKSHRVNKELAKSKNLLRVVFQESLFQSFWGMLDLDSEELISLRSYFLQSLFHSDVFAEEIINCQKHFQVNIPEMYGRILYRVDVMNKLGFVSGQITSILLGAGIIKGILMLPRTLKYLVLGTSVIGASYLSAIYITPLIFMMKKIREVNMEEPSPIISSSVNLTDVRVWARYYNMMIDLKELHLSVLVSLKENRQIGDLENHYFEILEKLHSKHKLLEKIRKAYLDAEVLSEEQNAQLELINYVLHSIKFLYETNKEAA